MFDGANQLLGPLEGLGHESLDFHGPTLVMDLPASKTLHTGPYQSESIGSFMYMSSQELPGPIAG